MSKSRKCEKAKRCSQTGTRTRVCWVRASHPNHLDYLGSTNTNKYTTYTSHRITTHTTTHITTHITHASHNNTHVFYHTALHLICRTAHPKPRTDDHCRLSWRDHFHPDLLRSFSRASPLLHASTLREVFSVQRARTRGRNPSALAWV